MKVTFTQPTQHDAKVYQPGDKADLPNAAAKALIDCGSAHASDGARTKAEAEAEAKAAAKAEADALASAEAEAEAARIAAELAAKAQA